MCDFQGRVVLVRKYKTVSFIDILAEGKLLSLKALISIIPSDISIAVGDILYVKCNRAYAKNGNNIWDVEEIRIVAKCQTSVSFKSINHNDILKRNRIKAVLGRANIGMWNFRSMFLNKVAQLMGEFGMARAYSSSLMDYRGTSTTTPLSCSGKCIGDKFLKITHEIELKKTSILTMQSVFDLSYVYRDAYETTRRVPEIMLLEGVILGRDLNRLLIILNNIIDLAITLAKAYNLNYDTRFEKVDIIDVRENASISAANISEIYNPTIFVNAPINSPFVGKDCNGEQTEVRLVVNQATCFHGYYDENSSSILQSAFENQYQTLTRCGISAEIPWDYLDLLKIGAPETISFGFGIDRFLTSFLMLDSIQETTHLVGI